MTNNLLDKPKGFLKELSEEHRHLLLSAGTALAIKPGKPLFQEGDKPESIYLILRGQIKISKMTEDGREMTLYLKQKGELVGSVSLFNSIPFTYTAQAIEPSKVLVYSLAELESLFEQHGQLATAYIKWHSKEAQITESKFRDLLLFGKTGALYSTLLRFSHSYGQEVEDGMLINVRLTNQELANYIGTSRENVNRMLQDLRQEEVIHLDKGYITILNVPFLKEYLRCGECPDEVCKI